MKKIAGLLLLISVSLFGCMNEESASQVQSQVKETTETAQPNDNDVATVEDVVERFGNALQNVSLLGPEGQLKKGMHNNYGDVVSPELIEQWLSDPLAAPGRLTSSPWPDRIDIANTEKLSANAYELNGNIIEIANGDEEVNKIPVSLTVEKVEKQWLITNVILGGEKQDDTIFYQNKEYSFTFKLPKTWKNYSIVTEEWEGLSIPTSGAEKVVETGPMISIRHPEWIVENPRQDIPIMIFSLEQWDLLQQEKFHIGAAPIGPSELNRNEQYVFAIPARYNFAFPTGYEEVEQILESKPLEVESN